VAALALRVQIVWPEGVRQEDASEGGAASSSGVGRHSTTILPTCCTATASVPVQIASDRASRRAVGAVDLDLDESMRRQRPIELERHGVGEPALPHLHDRLERMGAALEMGTFAGRQRDGQ
jgi:hypothetical protein